MTAKPIFPYRRNRKRPRPGKPGRQRPGGGRRVPQTPAELLPLIQPATKALAQMLAGHSKSSGQLVHARNILEQAERLAQDRLLDRLPPARREEFREQLARLKLTVADAEALLAEEKDVEEAAAAEPPAPEVSPERLRALALSLAASTSAPRPETVPEPVAASEEAVEERGEAASPVNGGGAPAEGAAPPSRPGRARERLRLKITRPASEGGDG